MHPGPVDVGQVGEEEAHRVDPGRQLVHRYMGVVLDILRNERYIDSFSEIKINSFVCM